MVTDRFPSTVSEKQPAGIGGWLLLPAIGLILMPILTALVLYREFLPLLTENHWQTLTTPETEFYHPLWAPILIFEIGANIGFIIFNIIVAILFFHKSSDTPTLYIILLALNAAFLIGDYILANMIPAVAAVDDPGSIREMVRGIIGALIWIPYFLLSKRVKNTFVN